MGLTAGIGHNGGPTIDGGVAWRTFAWRKARENLLPVLPIEVVRTRVKRAAELGLPYKTYAGIRASTGHDLIGFLFSTNALRMLREEQLAANMVAKLETVKADRTVLVHRPLDIQKIAALPQLDAAHPAPLFIDRWPVMRDRMRDILRERGGIGDRYLLVAETEIEREWVAAGKLAGMLSGAAFFDGMSAAPNV